MIHRLKDAQAELAAEREAALDMVVVPQDDEDEPRPSLARSRQASGIARVSAAGFEDTRLDQRPRHRAVMGSLLGAPPEVSTGIGLMHLQPAKPSPLTDLIRPSTTSTEEEGASSARASCRPEPKALPKMRPPSPKPQPLVSAADLWINKLPSDFRRAMRLNMNMDGSNLAKLSSSLSTPVLGSSPMGLQPAAQAKTKRQAKDAKEGELNELAVHLREIDEMTKRVDATRQRHAALVYKAQGMEAKLAQVRAEIAERQADVDERVCASQLAATREAELKAQIVEYEETTARMVANWPTMRFMMQRSEKAMRKVARMCYPLQEKLTALRVKETRQEEKKARRAGSAGRTPSIRVHSAPPAAALPPGRHRAPRAPSRASRTLMRLAPSGRRLGRC